MTETDPRKTAARFWDKIADRYARRPVADEASYQQKLRVTEEHLRPDMEVLEIGCGTGSTAIKLAPFVKKITTYDVSPRMIEIARDKAEASGAENVEFQIAAIDDMNVAAQTLDVVMAHSIFHLLEDTDAVIAKAHSWLKPGGLLISSTTCLGDGMRWFGLIAPIGKALGLFPVIKIFTEAELVRSLKKAGFEIAHRWKPGKGEAVFIIAMKRA